eukprot:1141960-Pelagomonas_calceolata.AAC.2
MGGQCGRVGRGHPVSWMDGQGEGENSCAEVVAVSERVKGGITQFFWQLRCEVVRQLHVYFFKVYYFPRCTIPRKKHEFHASAK